MPRKDLPPAPLEESDEAYRQRLDAMQYAVAREAHTERPFTGKYWDHWQEGQYVCVCCGTPLFDASSKFDAGCGWPSYDAALGERRDERVLEVRDTTHGMVRTEILCRACNGHLGHVFPDGPTQTGLRYCVNSASVDFKPAASATPSSPASASTKDR